MAFVHNLNYCMQSKGYSAYRLAKIIGSSNQAVLLWQAGKTIPHTRTRQKIADHFGITLAELDGDELPTLQQEKAKKNSPNTDNTAEAEVRAKIIASLDGLSLDTLESLSAQIDVIRNRNKSR